MKVKLVSKHKLLPQTNKIISNSLPKNKSKNLKVELASKPKNYEKNIKAPICLERPRIISIVQQKTQPVRNRVKRTLKQQPQFLKQFQEITEIYNQSKEIENEEDLSLFCFDQDLDNHKAKRIERYNISAMNRYSEKSSSQLPSIAEKDIEEERQDDLRIDSDNKHRRSVQSTATNHNKNTKSFNENFINQFQLKRRGKSNEKKISIDVQNLIKSRSKTKSSMSNKSSKITNKKY